MASKNFDENTRSEEGHDVLKCACYGCVLSRYWAGTTGVLAPSTEARVKARVAGAQRVPTYDLDIAVLKTYGDIFNDIAESERIDTAIHYRRS